jgi:DNA-binding transcriptional MerR regulator/effector-binding domain-containing protein
MTSDLLAISPFSRLCRLTVKALRLYDELGLLAPAFVDPASGYRYYALSQAADAERIRMLRAVGMPLDELKAFLRLADADQRRAALERRRARLEADLVEARDALTLLDDVLRTTEELVLHEVTVRRFPAVRYVGLRQTVPLARFPEVAPRAYEDLFGYVASMGRTPAGLHFAVYRDHELQSEGIDVEFGVPVDRPLAGNTNVHGAVLPAVEAASVVHMGPYREIAGAWHALGAWVHERGAEVVAPPREIYLVGPRHVVEPSAFRTEVVWPLSLVE